MRPLSFAIALVALSATSTIAQDATVIAADTPVVIVDTPPPVGSANSGYILLGLIAALIAATGNF